MFGNNLVCFGCSGLSSEDAVYFQQFEILLCGNLEMNKCY